MSLFGESSPEPRRNTPTSLFDDTSPQTPQKARKGGGGLFADQDDAAGDTGSPWDSAFTPKKQDRSDLIKNLLPADAVPDHYVDTFDALIEEGFVQGAGVSQKGFEKVLGGSSLTPASRSKILEITGGGNWDKKTFVRGEINVLLSLIGLAQEGEEVSLDSVDERRKNLPIPNIGLIRTQAPQQNRPAEQEPPKPSTPAKPSMDSSRLSSSADDPDPWSSPSNTFRSAPARSPALDEALPNGSTPQRTTSAYSTTAGNDNSVAPSKPSTSASGDAAEWGGGSFAPSSGGGFGSSDITGGDGFGAGGAGGAGGDGSGGTPTGRGGRTIARRQVSHGTQEFLTVSALSEKEGMFLFQYRNYEISSNRRSTKVVRRYSDFVWLLDCLHKRYPFRQLPLLPPKRVAINGTHLAAENQFLEKRRRGLTRFVNALIQHPVLREEQLVTMFLTVPTELAAWRKQAQLTIQEEFTGRTLPPQLEDSLPPTLEELFGTVRSGVRRSSELYINACNLVERQLKRREGLGAEYSRLASTLNNLTEASNETYRVDTNDVPLLNEGLTATAKHISEQQSILTQESATWDEGFLEDLKKQRDTLVSMRDLFDRRDRFDRDNIPQLEKRIAGNESKLEGVRAKPEGARKAGEAEKLEDAIHRDKQSIVNQHARSVFIRECIRDEIQVFLGSLYHVGKMFQEWAGELVRSAEAKVDNWREYEAAVESMPAQATG